MMEEDIKIQSNKVTSALSSLKENHLKIMVTSLETMEGLKNLDPKIEEYSIFTNGALINEGAFAGSSALEQVDESFQSNFQPMFTHGKFLEVVDDVLQDGYSSRHLKQISSALIEFNGVEVYSISDFALDFGNYKDSNGISLVETSEALSKLGDRGSYNAYVHVSFKNEASYILKIIKKCITKDVENNIYSTNHLHVLSDRIKGKFKYLSRLLVGEKPVDVSANAGFFMKVFVWIAEKMFSNPDIQRIRLVKKLQNSIHAALSADSNDSPTKRITLPKTVELKQDAEGRYKDAEHIDVSAANIVLLNIEMNALEVRAILDGDKKISKDELLAIEGRIANLGCSADEIKAKYSTVSSAFSEEASKTVQVTDGLKDEKTVRFSGLRTEAAHTLDKIQLVVSKEAELQRKSVEGIPKA
ncbi:MAG: hypothetical protein V4490_00880 [Pseudomonadota bacterium]